MQKTKFELKAAGMEYIFYIRFILLLLPVAILGSSLYWIIITSASIWMKAIGANILISNVFSFIFAIVSLILILFCIIGIMSNNFYISQLFFVSTVLCFISSFVTLSLCTDQYTKKYESDINDYCLRNLQTITDNKSLCLLNNLGWEISKYVQIRTTRMYDIYVGFLAPYIVIFIIFIIMCAYVSSKVNNIQQSRNQLSINDDQNYSNMDNYSNMETGNNQSYSNNDTDQLINTANNSQPVQAQNGEEKLNFDLDPEYEYITEEEEEDQSNTLDITVNPQTQTHPVDNRATPPPFIKLSDTA